MIAVASQHTYSRRLTHGTAEPLLGDWYAGGLGLESVHGTEDSSCALGVQEQLNDNVYESDDIPAGAIDALIAEDRANVARLNEFRELPPDWDSYGAAPVSSHAINQALRLLRGASALSIASSRRIRMESLSPLATGGVEVEWHGPGGELLVEIEPSGAIGYLIEYDGNEQEFDRADEFSVMRMLVQICRGQ